ncbi:hypothetical protein [Noviherbaspirillum autotrophicum]|nr:hypothetical protein [Noviherbaspirillum autotrophicum]
MKRDSAFGLKTGFPMHAEAGDAAVESREANNNAAIEDTAEVVDRG